MTAQHPSQLNEHDERLYTSLGNILGIIGIIPSLVVFLVFRERSQFLKRNMKSALNFQITLILADVIGAVTIVIGIGALIWLATGVLRLVLSILAFVKTQEGEDYLYSVTIAFIK
jgi:uncharacterized Tic20 family protein